jgi:hypothetical protein
MASSLNQKARHPRRNGRESHMMEYVVTVGTEQYDAKVIGETSSDYAAYVLEISREKLGLEISKIKQAIFVVGKVVNFVTH